MNIVFKCSKCGKQIGVDAQWAGKKTRCPYCVKMVTVPGEIYATPMEPPEPFQFSREAKVYMVGCGLGLLICAIIVTFMVGTGRMSHYP